MSNKKLTKRVQTLIENKSQDFKEKYYLLSYLANTDIKLNEKLVSEADCYMNVLINTNGVKPNVSHIHNLLKEAIKIKKQKKYKKEFKYVKELCMLINKKDSSLNDNLIFEELSNVNSLNDFKLNKKLKTIFLESIYNNTPLLIKEIKSDSEEIDNTPNLDDTLSSTEDLLARKSAADEFEDEEDAYNVPDEEWSEEKLVGKQPSLSAKQKDILRKYEWLFKPENIPYISRITGIYLTDVSKKGGQKQDTSKNLSNIPDIDKLAVIAKYKLIVEDKATNVAMRKYHIINQIFYYLNIQKRFVDSDLAKIASMADKGALKDINKTLRGSSPSGISEEEKTKIKLELNDLILKINTSDITTLDSNVITERELFNLLKRAAGNQRENLESFMLYLNNVYPVSGNHRTEIGKANNDIPNRMSDEEYEEYLRGNRELDAKEALEDAEEYDESSIDPETGEPLYANIETAAKIASSYVEEEDFEEIEIEASDAIQLLAKKSSCLKKLQDFEAAANKRKKLVKSSEEERRKLLQDLSSSMTRQEAEIEKGKPGWNIRMFLSKEDREEFDKTVEEYSVLMGTRLIVKPDRTKKEAFEEIRVNLDKPIGANKLNPETGRVESANWSDFFERYLNYDPESGEQVSNTDIALFSQDQWSGPAGVRQSTNKSFQKALFYSSNVKVKSEIYAKLGKMYIDSARRLGLMEFDVSSVETKKDEEGKDILDDKGKPVEIVEIIDKGDAVGFRQMEDLITSEEVFEEYFSSGMSDEDEEDALNYLTMDGSSFDIFCNMLFDTFYSRHIWNRCEVKIGLGIKKYFEEKYPGSNIGQGLSESMKSWRADKVPKENGRMLFDTIINWTMGRSGIQDTGNVVSNPQMEIEQRKNSFLNGQGNFKALATKVQEFNAMPYKNKIIDFDPEHLMYDCLNDTSKVSAPFPIIGAAYNEASILTADDRSLFFKFIEKKKATDFEGLFAQSLMKKEYFDVQFKNPNSPLGNPAEISGIEKGEGSDSPADRGQPKSVKGAPYYRSHWREAIKSSSKTLKARAEKLAAEREERLSQSRDYSFLEDDELALTDYQVYYSETGDLAEIATVDMETGKARIIIDVKDASGNIVDAKTITVNISKLNHADVVEK